MLHKSGTRKQARDSLLVAARCRGEHIGHGAGTHRQQAFIQFGSCSSIQGVSGPHNSARRYARVPSDSHVRRNPTAAHPCPLVGWVSGSKGLTVNRRRRRSRSNWRSRALIWATRTREKLEIVRPLQVVYSRTIRELHRDGSCSYMTLCRVG